MLTSFGRTMKITQTIAKRLPETPRSSSSTSPTRSTSTPSPTGCASTCRTSTACCTRSASPRRAPSTSSRARWEDVSTALQISAYSLKSLAVAALPLMSEGGSVVGLTFDAKFAWPVYDWMGVAKAAFESTNRYLARDLGPKDVRCNLVAAGPIRTTAAKSIPGFEQFEKVWDDRAPLGWDVNDPVPAAKACAALLSDWFPATTGEIVHVDGGVHAMGQ